MICERAVETQRLAFLGSLNFEKKKKKVTWLTSPYCEFGLFHTVLVTRVIRLSNIPHQYSRLESVKKQNRIIHIIKAKSYYGGQLNECGESTTKTESEYPT